MNYDEPGLEHYSRSTARYTAKHSTKGGRRGSRKGGKRRRGVRPSTVILTIILILVLAVGGGLVGGTLYAKSAADDLTTAAHQLASDIADSNADGMRDDMKVIDAKLTTLDLITSNPIWSLASNAPVVGNDMKAVAEVVDVGKNLNEQLIHPVAEALIECPLNMLLDGGNVNPEALNKICEAALNSRDVVRESSERINAIDNLRLAKVINIVNTIRRPLRTASSLLDENAGLIEVLPAIFGLNESRTYLVVAQNNAEMRPVGGMPGTYVPVTIENGQISFGEATSATALRAKTDDYNIPITDEEEAIYTHNLGDVASDFNRSADFSRDAEIMAQGWNKYWGGAEVDGIIGMDVVMFQRLVELAATEVTLEDGRTVDTSQLAALILHDVCWEFINDENFMTEMDEYDDAVLSSSLAVFRSNIGSVDLEVLFDTICTGFDEGRLNVWMSRDEEEAAFDLLGATGKLFNSEEEPTLGIYFFDYTYSKMDWYFHTDTTINSTWVNDEGKTCYSVTTTLTNNITTVEASEATSYITGESEHKIKASDMITAFYLYAPMGGEITDVQRSGGTWYAETMVDEGHYKAGINVKYHDGHEVTYGVVHLCAGESTSITYTVIVSPAAAEELAIHTTPTAN